MPLLIIELFIHLFILNLASELRKLFASILFSKETLAIELFVFQYHSIHCIHRFLQTHVIMSCVLSL